MAVKIQVDRTAPPKVKLPLVVMVPAALLFVYAALPVGYGLAVWVLKGYNFIPWERLIFASLVAPLFVGAGVMLLRRRQWARYAACILGAVGGLSTIQSLSIYAGAAWRLFLLVRLTVALGILIPLMTKGSDHVFPKKSKNAEA